MSDVSERARVRRNAGRGVYDRATVYAILDGQMVCQVAYVSDGEPRMIPTLFMRRDNYLYLHGNRSSALLRYMADGGLVCVSVMAVDGVVVARSGFHCSMNYRSVSLFGTGELVAEADKRDVLDGFVDVLIPGHAAAVRAPTPQELNATSAVRVALDDCAAKVRSGDPIDDDGDLDAPCWAGVIPLATHVLTPQPAANLAPGIELPDYVREFAPGELDRA